MTRRLASEDGQVLPLLVAGLLVALLGIAGIAIDVGQGLWVKRQLQAAADAAALVGAQALPDAAAVGQSVTAYGPGPTAKNAVRGATGTTTTYSVRCLNSTPSCSAVNAVRVDATASVSTSFLGLFGLGSYTVKAHATACSPCGSKPLDVMFVLDRTGSMCAFSNGANDPSCTDLSNARAGMKAFLQLMDPSYDHVGLAVLPPAPSVADRCGSPADYDTSGAQYVVVPLSSDYLTPTRQLNTSSNLVSTINCIKGAGSTGYATAIDAAQDVLAASGRPNVPKVIVFLSDGAANDGPTPWKTYNIFGFPVTLPDPSAPVRTQPCHAGITSADAARAAGTVVYSIGYDVTNGDPTTQICANANNHDPEQPSISAYQALQQIADAGNFYVKPSPGQLQTIFTNIATDVLKGSSKLVADDA